MSNFYRFKKGDRVEITGPHLCPSIGRVGSIVGFMLSEKKYGNEIYHICLDRTKSKSSFNVSFLKKVEEEIVDVMDSLSYLIENRETDSPKD